MFLVIISAIALAFAVWFWSTNTKAGTKGKLPPGPPKLPFLGNLHQFDPKRPHVTLDQWAKSYGDVVYARILNQNVVVLNSIHVMKEALLKDGENFAGRQSFHTLSLARGGNYGYVTTDGQFWRDHRRFALHVLRDFGLGRSMQEDKIALEATELCRYISEAQQRDGKVDVSHPFRYAVVNIINNILFGERFTYGSTEFRFLQEQVNSLIVNLQKLLVLEFAPALRHVPPLSAKYAEFEREIKEFAEYMEKQVDKHEENYEDDLAENAGKSSDFTYAYIGEMRRRWSQQKDENRPSDEGVFTKKQLEYGLQDLFSAGFETTATTLTWFILYMVRNPDVQEKMHQEMLANLTDVPTWQDRVKLPYCSAVVAEIQRSANIVPLGVFHRNFQTATVSGYEIPAGSLIVTNLWSIMRDERVFPDPDTFNPERFLEPDGSMKTADAVVPFSIGKRSCLGEGLARMELFMFATALVHRFRFKAVGGVPTLESRISFTLSPLPFDVSAEQR